MYPIGYAATVFQIQQTEVFGKWLAALRDTRAKARILARLEAVHLGHLGDIKAVGGGVSEMRVDVGAGYRLYFVRRHTIIIVLLCGGDKGTQRKDISRAKAMARELDQE
jgi:putative addiction module killer protein